MSRKKPRIHGKRGFQILSRAKQRKTFGTWMRWECFGRLYQIVVLGKSIVMEARRARNG